MNCALALAAIVLSLEPQGSPSWEDVWFFLPFAIVISILSVCAYLSKKKGSNKSHLFGFFIGFLFLAMLFLYDPFLATKSKSLVKATLSTWLSILFIVIGALTLRFVLHFCSLWRRLTTKKRIYGIVTGLIGIVLCVLSLSYATSLDF